MPTVEQPDKPAAKSTVRGRLPNHFGKLGISLEQRNRIYKLQASYREQIADLNRQIAMLRSEETREVEGVLSDDQRLELKRHQDEAAEKRAERKKPVVEAAPEQ